MAWKIVRSLVIHQVDGVLIFCLKEQLLLRSTAKWTCTDTLVVEAAARAESTLSGKWMSDWLTVSTWLDALVATKGMEWHDEQNRGICELPNSLRHGEERKGASESRKVRRGREWGADKSKTPTERRLLRQSCCSSRVHGGESTRKLLTCSGPFWCPVGTG